MSAGLTSRIQLSRLMHRLRRPYVGVGSTQPLSRIFGYDRGRPIDRYYIEAFLERRSGDIRGRVLEIGDATYSSQFGGDRIERQDILHVHAGNPIATIVGDMTQADVLPEGAFDCQVFTQTLHLIYDMRAAVERLYASLAPEGVALVTVPGITSIDVEEWRDIWCWALTETSARRLFTDVFGAEHVEVESFGNVLAATAFLRGAAVEEVGHRKLDVLDPAYPVIITIRAQKAKTPPLTGAP